MCQKAPVWGANAKGKQPCDHFPFYRAIMRRPWAAGQSYFFGACLIAAWAAANRATGTRNGEQLT